MTRSLSLLVALAAIAMSAQTQQEQAVNIYQPDVLEWKEGPAALLPGARMAVVKGDPTKPGLFTMRLWFPADYRVDPHWHVADEHVTVISGALHIGMGERFDREMGKPVPEGGFMWMPAGTRHFGWTEQETEIQLHGTGPWVVNYINPEDDPRRPGQQ